MRCTLFVWELVTQIAPSPEATRVGVGRSATSSTIAPLDGSMTPTEFALIRESEAWLDPPPKASIGIATAAATTPATEPITSGRW
jgi:hypothetical protein